MIYKFLDRPVPFTLIQDANRIKEEMISEFERKYFKLSNVYRNWTNVKYLDTK